MSISINSFRAMAGTGGKTVEISQTRPGTLKASGFWGRLFGKAGKNAERNHQVMDELCAAIRSTMGKDSEVAAEAYLQTAKDAGRPLKGYMIRQVFEIIDMPRKELAAQNAATLAFARNSIAESLSDDLTWEPSVRREKLNSAAGRPPAAASSRNLFADPLDSLAWEPLTPADAEKPNLAESGDPADRRLWKEIDRFLETTVKNATAQSTPASLGMLKRRVGDMLTPERTAAAAALCDAARGGIPLSTMEALRPIILMSGVPQNAMGALVDLAVFLKDRIGSMTNAKDGIEMLTLLKDIRNEQARLFADVEPGEGADLSNVFNYAIQCALEISNMQPGKAADLAEKIFTSAPAREIAGALNRGVSDNMAVAGELRGIFTGMLNGFSCRSPVRQTTMDGILHAATDSLAPRTATYLMGEGVLKYNSVAGVPGFNMVFFGGVATGEQALRLIDASGSEGLPGVDYGTNTGFLEFGRIAMDIYYDAAAAGKPEETPSPQQFWKTLFNNDPLPKGITRDNLAAGVGRKMQQLALEAANQLGDTEFQDPDDPFEKEALVITTMQAMSYGLDPRRALAVRRNEAGARVLERHDFQRLPSGNAPGGNPAAAIQEGVRLMALDLPRLHDDCSVTIGNDRVELKNVPDAENGNYRAGRADNPIVGNITDLVTNFCPDARMQRAAVFTMLSQASELFMRVLGPTLKLPVDEHTGTHMTLTRLDGDTVRLTLQTPRGVGYDVRAEYAIARDGSCAMTNLRLADFEDPPAAQAAPPDPPDSGTV